MSAGLNLRLMSDNAFDNLEAHMTSLGWFDAGRKHRPVKLRDYPADNDEVIEPNFISLALEDQSFSYGEVGSNLTEQKPMIAIDIMAESQSVGLHLMGDIAGWAQNLSVLEVYDLTMATPELKFYCEVDNVYTERVRGYTKPHQKFWWVVMFTLERYEYAGDL